MFKVYCTRRLVIIIVPILKFLKRKKLLKKNIHSYKINIKFVILSSSIALKPENPQKNYYVFWLTQIKYRL